jgi:amidase
MRNFRIVPGAAALAVALAACSNADAPSPAAPPVSGAASVCDPATQYQIGGLDLQTATVLDLQHALAAGTLTSEALVQRELALIAAFDINGAKLNAVRALAPDLLAQARAADARRRSGGLRGPLDGLTVMLKDNIGTTDLPTTAGSIALATNVPLREATITRRLREAGAIVMGKANLSEFANWVSKSMPNGYSSLGGQVIAPYGSDLDPLGSSTGSSVAATMGFATVTVGSETSGSIIAPSSVQSDVGVKPSLGLVSRVGIIPLAPSFDTAGPITRTVTDAAALLQVLAYADPEDPLSQRFTDALGGVVPDYLGALSTDALQGARIGVRAIDLQPGFDNPIFDAALDVLRAQGATIVTIDDPAFLTEEASLTELGAIFNEFKFSLNHYLATESGPDTIVETLSDIIAYNSQHTDKVKYGQNLLQLSDAQSGLEIDPVYLAARTAAITASQLSLDTEMSVDNLDAIVTWYLGWSNIGATAAAGYPNVTVPMGYYTDHQPVGLEIAGAPFTEAKLLGYAYAYEQASRMRQPATVRNAALNQKCGS